MWVVKPLQPAFISNTFFPKWPFTFFGSSKSRIFWSPGHRRQDPSPHYMKVVANKLGHQGYKSHIILTLRFSMPHLCSPYTNGRSKKPRFLASVTLPWAPEERWIWSDCIFGISTSNRFMIYKIYSVSRKKRYLEILGPRKNGRVK